VGNPRIRIENSSTKRLHISDAIVPLLYGWVILYREVMTDIPSLLVLRWFEAVRVNSYLSHLSSSVEIEDFYGKDRPPSHPQFSFTLLTWKSNAKDNRLRLISTASPKPRRENFIRSVWKKLAVSWDVSFDSEILLGQAYHKCLYWYQDNIVYKYNNLFAYLQLYRAQAFLVLRRINGNTNTGLRHY
jgi:hypothetical protein